jgi:hypothetical protein
MSIIIHIELNGSFAVYEVTHEIDGIYLAKLLKKSYHIPFDFPEKIILLKSGGEWISDFSHKEIGLIIGHNVDEELKRQGDFRIAEIKNFPFYSTIVI